MSKTSQAVLVAIILTVIRVASDIAMTDPELPPRDEIGGIPQRDQDRWPRQRPDTQELVGHSERRHFLQESSELVAS